MSAVSIVLVLRSRCGGGSLTQAFLEEDGDEEEEEEEGDSDGRW